MNAPASDPTRNMKVKALLVDQATGKPITFDLTFSQQGRPFFVWGTGVNPDGQGEHRADAQLLLLAHAPRSLRDDRHRGREARRVRASRGWTTSTARSAPRPIRSSGSCRTCSSTTACASPTTPRSRRDSRRRSTCAPRANARSRISKARSWFVDSFVTPIGRTWTSETGVTYFLQFRVEIPSFNASLIVTSLVPDQAFNGVYEGVADARGTFEFRDVTGTAWNEQAL